MSRSFWFVCAFCLAALLLVAPPVGAADIDITGKYKIVDDNNKVIWTIEIAKVKNAYKITWTEKSSGNTVTGVGVQDGDVLAASWGGSDGDHGVYLYHIVDKGAKLTGKWAREKGRGNVFNETAIKLK